MKAIGAPNANTSTPGTCCPDSPGPSAHQTVVPGTRASSVQRGRAMM